MMQKLCAFTQRVNAAAARAVQVAVAPLGVLGGLTRNGLQGSTFMGGFTFAGMATTDTTGAFGTAWNVKPLVHTTAICTHGKRYERRLQEMLT